MIEIGYPIGAVHKCTVIEQIFFATLRAASSSSGQVFWRRWGGGSAHRVGGSGRPQPVWIGQPQPEASHAAGGHAWFELIGWRAGVCRRAVRRHGRWPVTVWPDFGDERQVCLREDCLAVRW